MVVVQLYKTCHSLLSKLQLVALSLKPPFGDKLRISGKKEMTRHVEKCATRARVGGGTRTRMSVVAMQLSLRYSTALCCSSTSALRSWLSERRTSWMVLFTSGNRLMNLM